MKIMVIRASNVIFLPYQFTGYDPVKEEKNDQGNTPLEQNRTNRISGSDIQPVLGITLVAVPEPPDKHGDQLDGQDKHD